MDRGDRGDTFGFLVGAHSTPWRAVIGPPMATMHCNGPFWGQKCSCLAQNQCFGDIIQFLGLRGPLKHLRPSVRPRQKSESPLKPYKSSQDHARHLI